MNNKVFWILKMFLIPKYKIQILKKVFRYFQVQMDYPQIIANHLKKKYLLAHKQI